MHLSVNNSPSDGKKHAGCMRRAGGFETRPYTSVLTHTLGPHTFLLCVLCVSAVQIRPA